MSKLACQGCGAAIAADSPNLYRCPNAGHDAGEHVVGRTIDAARLRLPVEGAANPFERYRALTHAYALALSHGLSDDDFVALVRSLDDAVRAVDGHGFAVTPFARSGGLSDALNLTLPGGVWVKNETRNVSGSHKGRHLMGLAILGEVQAQLGILPAAGARLAIASCGNAALAAAVVARAWKRPLDVFIPPDANPNVVAKLEEHGATVHTCVRKAGVVGDPCYQAFRDAVARGAVPFCCQGSDHGLTVEGGETLGWEIVSDLLAHGRALDRLFVQVGGGALASSCVQAFRDAASVGAAVPMPKIHAVQTEGAHPLHRAWKRVRARADSTSVEEALSYAAAHRAEFMWPWETVPQSVAHGILDDETYDWLAIVRGMLESGGYPIIVSEERLLEANALGRSQTNLDVDPTGSSGLAGVLELSETGAVRPSESIGVLFTGVRR